MAEHKDHAAKGAAHEAKPEAAKPAKAAPAKTFTVDVPNTALPKTVVEAADAAGAVEAYKAKHGIWNLPAQASAVEGGELPDEEAPPTEPKK